MNLYIYSDLLFGNNNGPHVATTTTTTNGDSTATLLSYSKLLKDPNSRNQFFGSQSIPRKPLGIIRAKNAVPSTANSGVDFSSSKSISSSTNGPTDLPLPSQASSSSSSQTQTYLVDLNKQSLDSLALLNMSSLPRSNRSVSLNSRRWNENVPGLALQRNNDSTTTLGTPASGRLAMEFLEGSRMTIGKKTTACDEAIGLTPGQFRLRAINNVNKNLSSPRHGAQLLNDSFLELRQSLRSSSKPKPVEAPVEQKKKPPPITEPLNQISKITTKDRSPSQKPPNISEPAIAKKQTRPIMGNQIEPICLPSSVGLPSVEALLQATRSNHSIGLGFDALMNDTTQPVDEESAAIKEEFKYRVESPHKLSKSGDEYKFASNSSINLESHRKRHRLIHDHFEMYQSSYFSTNQ